MTQTGDGKTLLQLEAVRKYFPLGNTLPWSRTRGYVRAVDGVSFEIYPHETLSLVGESGCGKTTTANLVLRLEDPTAGSIIFQGQDVHTLKGKALRRYRASVQAVFQDPWSSLNPRMRAGDIIAEPLVLNQRLGGRERQERVTELLLAVGLEPTAANNFPHEFSGGMRQRLAVARALALHPSLIVLDEPVSALDVSIRAQIMNLLKDLQERFGMAYLLIAHNLATVRYLSHRVAVMYLGQIVESAPAEEMFTNPLHPYTKALISAAVPVRPGEEREEILLSGEVPSPTNPPLGCRFHPRCPFAFDRCSREVPQLRELAPGHQVACHLY
ncbi:MAG: ATP-binding cassette domain-containing protein [Nitrospinae bacterium]|nr:ATP-binding cassette domain-containing protein [Nitrospinota bacterium]